MKSEPVKLTFQFNDCLEYTSQAGHIVIHGGGVSRTVIQSMIEASGIPWKRTDKTAIVGTSLPGDDLAAHDSTGAK